MPKLYFKMESLTDYELELFCKVAKTIIRKGHLELSAILKFIHSEDHKKDKKIILKFYKLQLLQTHRTNTFELASIGRMLAMNKCEWFQERY